MTNPDNSSTSNAVRSAAGTGRASNTTPPNTTPQGFRITDEQVRQEANISRANDRGDDNTRVYEGITVSVRSDVTEETTQNPFSSQDNSSIQSVGIVVPRSGPDKAVLNSSNYEERRGASLIGYSDGKVELSFGPTLNPTTIDITDAAARAGITAAGIRLLQQNVARDGEVDRGEQQQIINMVNTAKRSAGLRVD